MRTVMRLRCCAMAAVVAAAVVSSCLAENSSLKSYSELLKEAVFKSSRGIGPRLSTRHRRDSQLSGSPRFIPRVEGLDDPSAVPFLLKVIYEGPDWDPDDRFSQPRYRHIAKCYAVLSLAASGDP